MAHTSSWYTVCACVCCMLVCMVFANHKIQSQLQIQFQMLLSQLKILTFVRIHISDFRFQHHRHTSNPTTLQISSCEGKQKTLKHVCHQRNGRGRATREKDEFRPEWGGGTADEGFLGFFKPAFKETKKKAHKTLNSVFLRSSNCQLLKHLCSAYMYSTCDRKDRSCNSQDKLDQIK